MSSRALAAVLVPLAIVSGVQYAFLLFVLVMAHGLLGDANRLGFAAGGGQHVRQDQIPFPLLRPALQSPQGPQARSFKIQTAAPPSS